MANNNDLNMLLKAQVVKIRAELDIPKSMPKIRKQVAEISDRLKDRPVKLGVQLNYKISELNKQIKNIQLALNSSKTIKPIKLKVDIDVAGSAKNIKRQLQDIYKIVGDFNRKYGKQMKQMQQQMQAETMKNVPMNAMVGGFDPKAYAKQVSDAKRMMKDTFGKGIFTAHEFKDAQGNLQGFVGQLEKANGVVQKIRYQWDANAKKFAPINQQTVDSIEKHVNRASKSLRGMYTDIERLQKGRGQSNLFKQYEDLERRISSGTLTDKAVQGLRTQIKEERVLQEQISKGNKEYYQRQELLRQIRVSQQSHWKTTGNQKVSDDYAKLVKDVREGTKSLDEMRLQYKKINDESKKLATNEKEHINNTKKRLQVARELRNLEKNFLSSDVASKDLIREIKLMSTRAQKEKEWLEIKKRMDRLHSKNTDAIQTQKSVEMKGKLIDVVRRLGQIQGKTYREIERDIASVNRTELRGLEDLRRMYEQKNKQMKEMINNNKRLISEGRTVLSSTNVNQAQQLGGIRKAVNNSDLETLKQYIGQVYKGKVETVSMEKVTDSLGRTVDRLNVRMMSTGKTVQSYVVDLDRANRSLREVRRGMEYNANRNLGIVEQMKIAMQRVPVWMGAMSMFYGSIRSIRAVSREILEVDKAITELKRVMADGVNIDLLFEGSVKMSRELGNNIHDIMQTLNDFARTYGEFNERQLLAITNTATLMSNVSELGAQEAGETLVATMNAFNIEAEESIRIVDAMNEVDNNFAVSTQQLAEGMSKGASTAKTFGVEMEDVIGHITAVSSVTMESGKIIGKQ